jgi:hypothetical protein
VITSAFDLFQYLNDKNISYSTSGKNISDSWIGINCIYPLCFDNNFHLGINLQSKMHYCWKCGSKGSPTKLIKIIENCTWNQAKEITEQYQNLDLLSPDQEPEVFISKKLVWPKEFKPINPNNIPKVVHDYLTERNFNPNQEASKRNLFYPGLSGEYKYRLVVPIESKRKIVNFTARALSDKNPLSWKTCPNEKAEIDINDLLYGYDDIEPESPLVIVEGIFDQWRLGTGSIAIFKSDLTPIQVSLIRAKKPTKVFILLDEDTLEKEKPEKIASKLWFTFSEIVEIGVPDPAMLSQSEASNLMKELYK